MRASTVQQLIEQLRKETENWLTQWYYGTPQPILSVGLIDENDFVLFDTREINNNQTANKISKAQAQVILFGNKETPLDLKEWALNNNYAVKLDEKFVPLAVTEELVLHHFGLLS